MGLVVISKRPGSRINPVVKATKDSWGDFKAILAARKNAVFGVCGLEKCGKSHFSMTAPGPLAIIDIDTGLDGVVQKFDKKFGGDKLIHRCEIEIPDQIGKMKDAAVKAKAQASMAKFKRNYELALKHPDIRSIIIDNSTSLWELNLLSHFGKTVQIPQHMRVLPNLEMTEIVRRPLTDHSIDKNVIHILRVKKMYKGDNWSGKYEPAGYNQMGFLVQAMLMATRDKDQDFWIEVLDCRHNPMLNGAKWMVGSPKEDNELDIGPFTPFQFVASEILDHTSPMDWE